MDWCYVAASVRGTSHVRAGTKSQDVQRSFVVTKPNGEKQFVAVVSDGAGSAKFGGQGASLICRTIAQTARNHAQSYLELPNEEVIWSWVNAARNCIQLVASKKKEITREFAATMILLMASSKDIVIAHIGDGAVVARQRDSSIWTILSEPHNGEYTSTTYFVTDESQPELRISKISNQFSALVLFSDGIENLVIDSQTKTASPAFFSPMATPLDNSSILGKDKLLTESLKSFLDSDRINERTDDDKTLIIAVVK